MKLAYPQAQVSDPLSTVLTQGIQLIISMPAALFGEGLVSDSGVTPSHASLKSLPDVVM